MLAVTMSQKVSRKTISEDKDKRSTNSPVKDMKKKVAANAEKEKLAAAEKNEKAEKAPEKSAEKTTEKADKSEKHDKSTDKKSEKKDHTEKKNDKPEQLAEKSKEDGHSKEDKSGKSEKEKPESKKAEPSKQKQNGRDRVHNGVSDVTLGNGTDDVLNGTVSADSEDDDAMLVIDDHDELFPELTYDDTSDVECFEPPTPESVPSRSFTRRSQVKATRTPETPRPASDKLADTPHDEPKDSKLLKLKEDAPLTDRKLRSSDSPKPQETKKQDKQDTDKKQESDKKEESGNDQDSEKKETDKEAGKDVVGDKNAEDVKKQEEKVEVVEVVIEVESNDGEEVQRKTDTNYSKSRVKVSPYRRSMRLADQTNTSVMANYTGNNTTMEMDISESSSTLEESALDDSSYLRGLRSIRGRSSYKPLKEMNFKHVANRSVRSNTSITCPAEQSRPTGTVVGRKRKPDEAAGAAGAAEAGGKRLRVLERLERLAEPLRRVAHVALPAAHRRNAEIVGINTDLPLSAPVATPDTFDPESLKGAIPPPEVPVAVPLGAPPQASDNKRCIVM
ncbi:unnamed protein product [Arctia plantaginis]|uniref:Uncharacterized protein n=1 Tax=Arctia plantaginis TaxID=874455 RepID=A0A8S0ZLC7_ARCPL|nr:unnamed protein product [Arctia plantaginis]